MLKKVTVGVLAFGVVAALWNEYRVWSEHSRRHIRKLHERRPRESSVNRDDGTPGDRPRPTPEGEVHVIDLSFAPWQSPEPPFADTEEPARLHLGRGAERADEPASMPTIVLTKFETQPRATSVSARMFSVRGVWPWIRIVPGQPGHVSPEPSGTSPLEPEALFVKPRLVSEDK